MILIRRSGLAAAWVGLLGLLLVPNLLSGQKKKHPPAHPIDLNTATVDQLEQIPGIGPVTAKKIVQFRTKSGPFRSVNDLLVIPRISKRKLDQMRPYITVGPAKPQPKPHTKPQPKKQNPTSAYVGSGTH